ncbi:MAG: hypothetical protein WBP46_16170 [Thiolinea sp.]
MSRLDTLIHIRPTYNRSINLQRDVQSLELIEAYVPTAKSMQVLEQLALGLQHGQAQRALALIGPYGSGKSAFALFVSALLSQARSPLQDIALKRLSHYQQKPLLVERLTAATQGLGYLRIVINGTPTSLIRQLLNALLIAMKPYGFHKKWARTLNQALQANLLPSMNEVLGYFEAIQTDWAGLGGQGVLLEIDELGKFLEYEAYHPQHREIHLLQLLAEHAQQAHAAPLTVLVILHQSFEHYTQRLGKQLREEWQKIQGRFTSLAFLEPAEQSLRLMAQALHTDFSLPYTCLSTIEAISTELHALGALPHDLSVDTAQKLFIQCYPLHPLAALILPMLCQKVAQNERTLFSYLNSHEPFGLQARMAGLKLGDWILPADLYDYFILNHTGSFSDPLTHHRWLEVITALERLDLAPEHSAVQLLKTIGLLNLIGNQRGLKASYALLKLAIADTLDTDFNILTESSSIHFRQYNQEYRVWQGSDFDLSAQLDASLKEFADLELAEKLNSLKPFKPIVARRATISTGTLRSFQPYFASKYTRVDTKSITPRIIFYLAEADECPLDRQTLGRYDIIAVFHSTERLHNAVITQLALLELPKHHAALHQDPVAQREHREWLRNAELETQTILRTLIEEPETLSWSSKTRSLDIKDQRDLQAKLSDWIINFCYPQAPTLRNELINWDKPSTSASTGRKRLINAMLNAADQAYLGIEKTPAEMSLYLSLLKATGLHRQEQGQWGFYPLSETTFRKDQTGSIAVHAIGTGDPCHIQPMWDAITDCLSNSAQQIPLTTIYQRLRQAPFGIKQGVLPIFLIAYLLTYRREVALYVEGVFCEQLNEAQAELLCRRPELFAFERFELSGLQGELFDQYISSIVGNIRADASLLDIVKPLVRFMNTLPAYTKQYKGLSAAAQQVREAFNRAQSPGILLFKELPLACGINLEQFEQSQRPEIESFTQRLVTVLRELKAAYGLLLTHWQTRLGHILLDQSVDDLAQLRSLLAERYKGLDRYTPDRMGLGAFIRRLADESYPTDLAWLESTATLLGQKPPAKWTDENRLQADMRLEALGQQLRDLETLRLGMQNEYVESAPAMLIKWVDSARGTCSQVVQLSTTQQRVVEDITGVLTEQLDTLNEAQQWAVIARLLGRLTPTKQDGE